MKLRSFRVQNYKRIADTGWISCRDLTVLVGKNEAGKSALLRALSKLKPSDGEGYDGLREFPRDRYSDEFDTKDWPVASAIFELDDDEARTLAQVSDQVMNIETVTITRRYSGSYTVGFDPAPPDLKLDFDQFEETVNSSTDFVRQVTAGEGQGELLSPVKQTVIAGLDSALAAAKQADRVTAAHAKAALDAVLINANEDWQRQIFEPASSALQRLVALATADDQLVQARKLVIDAMPQFIYFDRYDVLEDAVHIPSFAQRVNSGQLGHRDRITHALFKHVGLDLDLLAELGRHEPGSAEAIEVRRQVDERAILTSSASAKMTDKFEAWWLQRRHKFRYDLDGDYFRVWVSDDLNPSEIELDQRSHGMQYFFSFYLVFLVEADETHVNSVLLLDEPGTVLHGTAQAKAVEFLQKLSTTNQVIYTTHSPFMVDVDHLESVRTVYEDDQTGATMVSDDVWPRDRDALFPLQAALGYKLIQGAFFGPRQVIIEGITDLWIIKALNHALGATDRAQLRDDLVLVPSAGVRNLLPLASLLLGNDIEIAALLDGDEPARREGKKLVDKLLRAENRCVFIGDHLDNTPGGELEDLFPEDLYYQAVKTSHPGIGALRFNAEEKQIVTIVDRLEAHFDRKDLGDFEKWKANETLRDLIIDDHSVLPDETLDRAQSIFVSLNELFGEPG